MTLTSLSSIQRTAPRQESDTDKVRTLIAKYLRIDVKRVTDEAHLNDDLGADRLDRLELMILIEDEFPGLQITDDDVDQMEVVGDLVHHIKTMNDAQSRANSRRNAWPRFRMS